MSYENKEPTNDNNMELINYNEGGKKDWFRFKDLLSWFKIIIVSVLVVYLCNNLLIVNANIPTGSMIPTVMPNDKIVANRLVYINHKPQRGDVVIFKFPDDENVLFLKRIIGLPGDIVEIKNDKIYINDKELNDPYKRESMKGNYGPYKVPEGQYFMLGDNRNNSEDSRFWQQKYVSKDKILGKAEFIYLPTFQKIE